jgi:hypothetical protein
MALSFRTDGLREIYLSLPRLTEPPPPPPGAVSLSLPIARPAELRECLLAMRERVLTTEPKSESTLGHDSTKEEQN